MVKKIGLPNYPETAMGAVVEDALIRNYSGNIAIIDENKTKNNKIDRLEIQLIAGRVKQEVHYELGSCLQSQFDN